jgi:hypothetical protein
MAGERRPACRRRPSLSPPAIIKQVAMAAAVVVTLVTGADYLARAVRLYRSPAPPGS